MKKLVLFIVVIVGLESCNPKIESHVVQEHAISEAVYASGEILPEEYNFIKSSTTAPILKIFVKEGEQISKGDILVILGSSDESDKIQYATNQVTIAKNNLNEKSAILSEIQNKIKLAELQYESDKNNAEKYQELLKEQAVSEKVAGEKSLIAERRLSELNALQKQYISTKNELNNLLMTAELQLANISQQYSNNVIKSNISGKVYSILQKQGDITTPSSPILLIGTENRYKLELMVDERDIYKIENGQKIFFESNTLLGEIHEAIVTKMNPVLLDESRCFKVEAAIIDNSSFFPKSTIEASIIVRENVSVLLVPFDYLIGDSLLTESNKIIWIKKGIRINDWMEITKGITKGDIILKPSTDENN